VTANTALRLGRYFATSAAFWMGIQTQYDLEQAEDELVPRCARLRQRAKPNPQPDRWPT
jgi:antitoxin HigA-1